MIFYNIHSHSRTHTQFVTYSNDTFVVCLLFGNRCSRDGDEQEKGDKEISRFRVDILDMKA